MYICIYIYIYVLYIYLYIYIYTCVFLFCELSPCKSSGGNCSPLPDSAFFKLKLPRVFVCCSDTSMEEFGQPEEYPVCATRRNKTRSSCRDCINCSDCWNPLLWDPLTLAQNSYPCTKILHVDGFDSIRISC